MMHATIYIVYSGADGRRSAMAIDRHLARRSDEISFWVKYDRGAIGSKEEWKERLTCDPSPGDLLLVLISPDMRRPPPHIETAIDVAQKLEMPIIPVRLDGAAFSLDEWPPGFSDLAHTRLDSTSTPAGYARQLDEIVDAARALLLRDRRMSWSPAPVPPPRRKTESATAAAPPFEPAEIATGPTRFGLGEIARARADANVRSTPLPPEIRSLLGSDPDVDVAAEAPAAPAPAPPAEFREASSPYMDARSPPVRRRRSGLLAGTAAVAVGMFGSLSIYVLWDQRSGQTSATPPAFDARPPAFDARPPVPSGRPGSADGPTRLDWLTPQRVRHGGLLDMPLLPLLAMAAAPASEPPAKPQPMDVVDISAFAPAEAHPETQVLVQVYLHKLRQLADVKERAARKDPDTTYRETATLTTEIPRGGRLGIELGCDGLSIREPLQHLDWLGRPAVVAFTVTVPKQAAGRKFVLTVRVLAGAIPIGRLDFALRIVLPSEAAEPSPSIQGLSAKRYRYAFFSYSSVDRVEVLKNARLLRALNIDFFQDLLSLEAGQKFEPKLFNEIDKCDLFLLFWSKSAAQSEWVVRETEHALGRQGGAPDADPHIKPIILEGPPVPRPPASLGHLHFNDFITHVITAIEGAPQRG
jgi:hypothetical protein